MRLTKKMSQVTLKMKEKGSTARIGLSWLTHCMEHFGVKRMTEEEYGVEKKSNREIEAYEKIMSVVMMRLSGGDRVEDVETIRADKELVNSLGWDQIAGADTVLNFIKEKENNKKNVRVNRSLMIKALRKSEQEEFTYDNDATYIDSAKKSASYSYNKVRQFSGLIGCIAELGLINTVEFRTGRVSPSLGIYNQLRESNEQVKTAGKRIKRFRSDSAAHQNMIFKYCDRERIEYYISLSKNEKMMKVIDGMEDNQWKNMAGKYEDQKGTKWAEGEYETEQGFRIRILILRWKNSDPTLFDDRPYCYHVVGTNNKEISPMQWLEVHNGRMGSIEQSHKELKGELGCDYNPSHLFEKNRGYFVLGVMAYNMMQILKIFYLGDSYLKLSVKRFRFKFINVCGEIVKTGRKYYCNLMNTTQEIFEMFRSCKSKLIINGY